MLISVEGASILFFFFGNLFFGLDASSAFSLFSGLSWGSCVLRWLAIHCICAYWVGLTTLITTHHHPSVYHPGRCQSTWLSLKWELKIIVDF